MGMSVGLLFAMTVGKLFGLQACGLHAAKQLAKRGVIQNETPHSPIVITDDVLYPAYSLRQGGDRIHR